MQRRRFLQLAAAAACAGALSLAPGAAAPVRPPVKKLRAKLGCQSQLTSDEAFRFYARYGVEAICGFPLNMGMKDWTVENLSKFKEQVESFGIALDMLQIQFWEWPHVLLGKHPDRDKELDTVCRAIETAAKAGISFVKYNLCFPEFAVLRSKPTTGRGGAQYPTWDLSTMPADQPPTPAGIAGEEEMWDRIAYILRYIVPVAARSKVRLACHPQDPPLPKGYRGVNHVLGTVEGLKHFVTIAESEYHGLNFCQGTVAEMLEHPGRDIYEVIRYFGKRGKIFNVHMRNIRGGRDKFQEVYPDEGDVDFLKAMRVYKEVDYRYMLMPDHVPTHPDDPISRQGFAFGYGYLRALMQAVNEE